MNYTITTYRLENGRYIARLRSGGVFVVRTAKTRMWAITYVLEAIYYPYGRCKLSA